MYNLGNNIVQKFFRVRQYFKSLILRNNHYASTLLTAGSQLTDAASISSSCRITWIPRAIFNNGDEVHRLCNTFLYVLTDLTQSALYNAGISDPFL